MRKIFAIGSVSILLLTLTGCSPNSGEMIPPASTDAPNTSSMEFLDATPEEIVELELTTSPGEDTAYLTDENIFLVLHGSSSCPVLPETATMKESTLFVVVAPITAEACTADFGPHVTKVLTSGVDVEEVQLTFEDGTKTSLPVVDVAP